MDDFNKSLVEAYLISNLSQGHKLIKLEKLYMQDTGSFEIYAAHVMRVTDKGQVHTGFILGKYKIVDQKLTEKHEIGIHSSILPKLNEMQNSINEKTLKTLYGK